MSGPKHESIAEILLLNPKGEGEAKESQMAARPATLKGRTIAVINAFRNSQGSSGELLTSYIGDLLLRAGVEQVLPLKKEPSAADMPQDTIEYLNSKAQGVVILEGD